MSREWKVRAKEVLSFSSSAYLMAKPNCAQCRQGERPVQSVTREETVTITACQLPADAPEGPENSLTDARGAQRAENAASAAALVKHLQGEPA